MEHLSPENRLRVLIQARESGNVMETCRLFGISRTVFYDWRRRYERFGMEGLGDRRRAVPDMPNRVSGEVERAILEYARRFPDDGPRRISYELSRDGVTVGETGVYRVLRRNGLARRTQRRNAAGRTAVTAAPVSPAPCRAVPAAVPARDAAVPGAPSVAPASPVAPEQVPAAASGVAFPGPRGRLLVMGTLLIKGEGYLFSAVECRSGFVFARLFSSRRAENAVKLLEAHVLPLCRSLGLSLQGVGTGWASEYHAADRRARHLFARFLESRGIVQYTFRDPASFPGRGLAPFYDALREARDGAAGARFDLDSFLRHYNCDRCGTDGYSALERLRRSCGEDEPLPLWCFLGGRLA